MMDSVHAAHKPALSLRQIANMSFGFFGIQIGFALQNGNVSRIFQTLGADIDTLPLLWLAGPVTGLVVQPVIGYFSDRTWGPFGRRRPYLLAGAILTTLALFIMPNAPALWIAAGTLWILDASLNITMEPFRALVGDMLPSRQRPLGFSMQTAFIGAGAVMASLAPYVFNAFGVSNAASPGHIPPNVHLAFYVGGLFLLCAVLWTVFRTKEYPPDRLGNFDTNEVNVSLTDGAVERTDRTARNFFSDILGDFAAMPDVMKQLALVQFFSWVGLFIMWVYTTPAVALRAWATTDPASAAYQTAGDWVGVMFALQNGIAAIYAFAIVALAHRVGTRRLHAFNLIMGALGFIGYLIFGSRMGLLLPMIGLGMAWGSILALPYSILSDALPPRKMGIYMGIFNFFIVLPQIFVGGTMGPVLRALEGTLVPMAGGAPLLAILFGAASLTLAAFAMGFVNTPRRVQG